MTIGSVIRLESLYTIVYDYALSPQEASRGQTRVSRELFFSGFFPLRASNGCNGLITMFSFLPAERLGGRKKDDYIVASKYDNRF